MPYPHTARTSPAETFGAAGALATHRAVPVRAVATTGALLAGAAAASGALAMLTP